MNAQDVIDRLGLEPLEHEGGFFRRVFTSGVSLDHLGASRPSGTVIFFLVTPGDFSALHLLKLPEFYTYLDGDPLELSILNPADGSVETHLLGPLSNSEASICHEVPAGVWQGSRIAAGGTLGWSLVSCILAPGFDWTDFSLGGRSELLRDFPESPAIIEALTRV